MPNVLLHGKHLKVPVSDPTMVRRTSAGRTNSVALLPDDVLVDDEVDGADVLAKLVAVGGIDLVGIVSLLPAIASVFAVFK